MNAVPGEPFELYGDHWAFGVWRIFKINTNVFIFIISFSEFIFNGFKVFQYLVFFNIT